MTGRVYAWRSGQVIKRRRLGYLSAAPRVSTRVDAEASGPRAHVLGVMRGFESLGWSVHPFIVGDRMPSSVIRDSERALTTSTTRTLMADILRLGMSAVYARRAWRELGDQVDWIYERLAAFQSLGWIFQRHGIPWILETNSPFFLESGTERKSLVLTGLARRREIAAYRRCDVLVCVSHALKDVIVREAGIARDKVLVIPNGVDTTIFDPHQHRPRRLHKGLTLGFVGYMIAWQGLDILFRAVAHLRDEGRIIHLTLVGDGPVRGALEDLARSLDIRNQVHFVGQVAWNEVPGYIAGFDVAFSGQVPLQLGSMYLSPLKLYEYMSMAKPVVASAFDDARALIEGKETGFLFRPGDGEDLNRVLRHVYDNREALPAMGDRARQEIIERHSWAARVREMIAHVDIILGGHGASQAG